MVLLIDAFVSASVLFHSEFSPNCVQYSRVLSRI